MTNIVTVTMQPVGKDFIATVKQIPLGAKYSIVFVTIRCGL